MNVGELKIKLSADAGELEKGIAGAKSALESIENFGGRTSRELQKFTAEAAGIIKSGNPIIKEAGRVTFVALEEAAKDAGNEIIKLSESLMQSVIARLAGHTEEMQGVGEDLVAGIGIGIMRGSGQLKEQINSMGQSVLREIRDVFEIASPSKKTAYLGQMIGEGLAAGISDSLKNVELQAGNMYSAATEAVQGSSYTYNTYNSTYNAGASQADNVKMADFENRLRRAYG